MSTYEKTVLYMPNGGKPIVCKVPCTTDLTSGDEYVRIKVHLGEFLIVPRKQCKAGEEALLALEPYEVNSINMSLSCLPPEIL